MAEMNDSLRRTGQHIRRTVREDAASRSDPLFHAEMSDMVEQDQAERARQALREHAMDAFNPRAALTRDLRSLFEKLDVPDIDDAIEEHMGYAGSRITIPIDDAQLDMGLVSAISLYDRAGIDHLLDKLDEYDPRWQDRFPDTADFLDEIGALSEGWDD